MAKSDDKVDILQRVPFLGACSRKELRALAQLVDEIHVPADYVLERQGESARQAFIVAEGCAVVSVDGEPIAQIGPGEFIGEIAMATHGPRSATVVATTPLIVFVLGPRVFDAVAERPEIRSALSECVARRLAELGQVVRG